MVLEIMNASTTAAMITTAMSSTINATNMR